MRLATATAYLLLLVSTTNSDAFRWNPLRRLTNENRHRVADVVVAPRAQKQRGGLLSLPSWTNVGYGALFAKTRGGFDDLGDEESSAKGFGSSSKKAPKPPPARKPKSVEGDDVERNGAEQTISSVKDVCADLNEEIQGALRSAENDLKGGDDVTLDAEIVLEPGEVGYVTAAGGDGAASRWDEFKGQAYGALDGIKARLEYDENGEEIEPAPAETPGERLMKERESIDVSSSSSAADEDEELAEAQREADEAEDMLRQAEEEAAMWERELADIEAEAAEAEAQAEAAEEQAKAAEREAAAAALKEEEDAALASMASAYQEALDAANENVDLLTSQISSLEAELASATKEMEKSREDKERIGAEYAFLAKNYGDLKRSTRGEELLGEEIEGYRSQIQSLEERLGGMEASLEEAEKEAARWKEDYEKVKSEMLMKLDAAADEGKGRVEELELKVLEVEARAEETRVCAQEKANTDIDALQREFDASISDNKKMVGALRQALRKTRKEKSYLEVSSSRERTKAVEDVRRKMDDEVANLKDVLKSLEGEMGQKEQIMKEAAVSREERGEMAEEMRELRESLQREKSNSAELTEEYDAQIAKYVENEKVMQEEMDELDKTIASLEKERNGNAKQVNALKLELEVLQSKVDESRAELEESNARLQQELDDAASSFQQEKSQMESLVGEAEGRISSLQNELEAKVRLATATEKALKETKSNLENFKAKYDREAQAAATLQEELKGANVKLAQVQSSKQASLKDIASQKQRGDAESAATRQQIQTLQSQANALAAQLKAANEKSLESERRLREYEGRVQSMSGTLLQSSTAVQTREDELAALKAELAQAKEEAKGAVARQSKEVEQLTANLERVKKQYSDSLAEANVEITQRGQVLERKERMLAELRGEYGALEGEMKDANAANAKKLEAQVKELQKMESSLMAERKERGLAVGSLEGQIAKLKEDMAAARADAQKTVAVRDDQRKEMERTIESLQMDIAHEQKVKEDVLRGKDELEKSLRAEIGRLEGELAAAQKGRAEALHEKEKEVVGLVDKNRQQLADMEEAKSQYSKSINEKAGEIAKLEGMVDTLTANVEKEVKLRQDVLAGKEGVESMLQKKLDDMVAEGNAVRADAEKKLSVRGEELKKMEADSKADKSLIENLKKDIEGVQAASQEAIGARNNEIQKMEGIIAALKADIANERKLRDEVVASKNKLEAALQNKIGELTQTQKKTEGVVLEKSQQMDQMKALIEKSKAAAVSEADANQRLQSELERVTMEMSKSLSEAEGEIQRRENTLLSLQKQNEQLESGKVESQRLAESNSKEIATLQEKVSALTANVEKEIKLRQDVLAGKEGVESMLQAKLNDMAKEMNVVRANAEKKLLVQTAELKKMEANVQSQSKEKSTLDAQIVQLKKDMSTTRENAQKAIDARNGEIKKMEGVIASLNADIANERKLRDDAAKSKSQLEAALQKKVDQLSHGMAVARTSADRAQKETEDQVAEMNSLKEEIQRERKLKERIDHDLKAQISQLEKELKEGAETNQSALKQRDLLLSTMRADLSTLSKLKEDAQTERDAIEKKLTAQNFELKNKISAFKVTADQSIKTKADEVAKMNAIAAELQARLAEETKARDAELAKMEESLRIKNGQIDQLAKEAQLRDKALDEKSSKESDMQSELQRLQSTIQEEAQLREKALSEKASVESKMQAELEALRADILTSRSNAEAAVNKLKEELKIEQQHAEEQLRAAAAAATEAQQRAEQVASQAAEEDVKAKAAAAAEAKAGVEAQQRAEEVTRQRAKMEQQQAKQQRQVADEDAKAKALAAAAEAKAQQLAKEQEEVRLAKLAEYEAEMKAAEEALSAKKQADALKKQAEANEKAKAAEALVAEHKVKVQERPKPKGFGKPAMKKAPPKKIQLEEGMTAEEAERARKARLLAAWGAPSPEDEESAPEKEVSAPAPTKSAEGATAEEAEAARLARVKAAEEEAKKLSMEKKEPTPVKTALPRTTVGKKTNPLTQLITPQGREGVFPERKGVPAPSSQAAGGGRASANPLTDLLLEKVPRASFPKRAQKVVAPSSQSTSPKRGPSFPKRDSVVAPPSSETQTSPPRQGSLSSPKRQSAVSTPSSQTTAPRQGVPAQNRDPAQTIVAASGRKNPLTSLITERDAAAAASFPVKQDPPAPSSQATREPPTSEVQKKKLALTDLLPSRSSPIRSNKHKEESAKSPPPPQDKTASAVSKRPPQVPPAADLKKRSSLRNLIPSTGRPLGSYGNRKTGTKLGGMASPESRKVVDDQERAVRQKAMKEKVVASAAAAANAPKKETSPASAPPTVSKLSALIQNQNPRGRLPRDGPNEERTSKTRLGAMANNPPLDADVLDAEEPAEPQPTDVVVHTGVAVPTVHEESAAAGDAAGMKKREAFQRALLSARIANDAAAKIFGVLPQRLSSMAATMEVEAPPSGLGHFVQGQNKPTLSQQKAFANRNRRTSLFPDKTESHMSRLLRK